MIFEFLRTKKLYKIALLVTAMLTMTDLLFGQVSLPVSTTTLAKSSLPSGFTHSGLGTDYAGPSLKFDDANDALVLFFSGTPNVLTFDLGVNNTFPGAIPNTATIKVQESSDGTNWTDLGTYSNVGGGTKTLNPNSSSTYIRWIYSIKPSGTNIALKNISLSTISCTAPTTQATTATFSATTNTSTSLSWTSGNGTAGRIVVMKEGSAVNGTPASGTTYTENAIFGSGSTIASNEYVVYNGTGNSVSVSGLKCNTTYHVKVFEFNTAGNCYNTTSPPTANTTTLAPTISSSSSLSGFTYVFGAGTSANQSYSLTATNLNPATGNIAVTINNSNYEISTDGTSFSPSLILPYIGGSLSATTIYVRLKAGLTVSATYPATITNTYTSSGTNCAASSTVTLSGSVTAPTPNIVLNSSNPAVVAGNITSPSTNNVIYNFNLGVSIYEAILSGVSITTTGTYVASNLTNLKCWYSADAIFDGSDQLLSTKTTSLGGGTHISPSFTNKTIASGTTGYIFITTDVPCTTAGNTISVAAITTADLTFTSGNKSGSAFGGGSKTFIDGATNNVISPATSNCVSSSSTVSWTLPTGCSDGILVFAKAAGSFSAAPSGNGSLYTANSTFGLGTSFDSGFCVYKGTGTSVNITGLMNGVNYTFIIYNRLGTTWSSGVTVNCTPTIAYCTPTYSTGTATNDWFSNVTLGTLNHTSTKSSSPFYTFFNAVTIPNITQGAAANVSVTVGADANQYVGVWIDFDQNGTFEPSEGLISANAGSGGTVTLNFLVPAGAVVGNTRMRVRGGDDSAPTTNQACGASNSNYGETKDYIVNIVASCTSTATISNFIPTSGPAETLATISGTGFSGATAVKFGTVNATSFTVIDANTIIAEVPAGIGASVQISVSDGSACATVSGASFSFINLTGSCVETSQFTNLYISEVYDSDANNSWFIELYNPTSTAINLANYKLGKSDYDDAITSIASYDRTFAISGTVQPFSTFLIYCGTSGNQICSASVDLNVFGNGINEDDITYLFYNDNVVDASVYTSIKGYSFRRKVNSSVVAPSVTVIPADWDILQTESCSDLGIVTFPPAPVSVTASPLDVTGCTISMSVTSPTPGVTYQWKFNDPATMSGWLNVNITNIPNVTISGASSAALSITGDVSAMLDFQFYCLVTESGCSTASSAAQFKYGSRPIYRSKTGVNGNWSDNTNWEMSFDGTNFVNACVYPRAINSSQVIVKNGTKIVLDLTSNQIEIDKLTIETNGELEMIPNAKLTVYDSTAGADLIVNGKLIDRNNTSNTIDLAASSTWILGASATFVKTNSAGISQYRDQYQGGMSTIPSSANWIFSYNGDGNPTVGSIDFYYPNLSFENAANTGVFAFNTGLMFFTGSAGKTSVKGNLLIGTAGIGKVSVHNANTFATPFLIEGNATIANGSSLTNLAVSGGTGFELKGNLTVNGTLDILGGSAERVLRLTGTTDQTIAGAGTINLYKLTVNKAAGKVILNRDLQAQHKLVMTNGHIYTNANLLELGLSTSQKGILNYTNGYVVGKMRRWFNGTNTNDTTSLFPLGLDATGLKNRFTRVSFTAVPTGGNLTVSFIASPMGISGLPIAAANAGGFGQNVTTTEDEGYWKIDNVNLNDAPYTIACTGEGLSLATITNFAGVTLLKRVGGGNWLCPGAHIATTGSNGMPTVSRSGVSGWSNFGFGGNAANPLPVELLSFAANCENGNVNLRWSTASEKNADYFIVEISENLENWKTVSTLPAAGNSSQQLNYNATDENPPRGISYYRLVQMDFDGKIEVYNPLSVNCTDGQDEYLNIYPNPSAGDFTLEWNKESLSGNVEIRISSSTGALVAQRTLISTNGKNQLFFQEQFQAGVYFISLRSENGLETVKLVVK